MIKLLQDFQVALGSFVVPLVLAMCGLLLFIIIVYTLGVLFHWKKQRTRKHLNRVWQRSIKEDNISSDSENIPRIQVPQYDWRDDFLRVLREADLSSEKAVDVYQKTGHYEQDKADLSSRVWWKRAQALHRLKYVSLEGLQDKLTPLVYDSSHEVRLIALDALGYLDGVPDLDPVKLFESFTEKLDSFLVIKLLTLKPGKSFIRPLVNSKKPRLRRAGATLLGQPSRSEFFPLLSELTGDENRQVRKRTAGSLGRVGGIKALSILKRTSRDGEPEVRKFSARSLGNIYHQDSIEILDGLASDDDFRVRLAAFSSLSRFGEEGRKAIGNHWSESRKLAREAIFESYQELVTSQ